MKRINPKSKILNPKKTTKSKSQKKII